MTGEMVKGKLHSQKGREQLKKLEDWLKNNSTASSLDVLNKGLTIFTNQQRTYPGVYSSFATQEQLDFLLKTSTDEKTSPIINSLMQTLSPWTRQEIRALSSSK